MAIAKSFTSRLVQRCRAALAAVVPLSVYVCFVGTPAPGSVVGGPAEIEPLNVVRAGTAVKLKGYRMSALGQKQTSRLLERMPLHPPKADIRDQESDVRFVPKADSCTAALKPSLREAVPITRRRGPSSKRPPVSPCRSHGQQLAMSVMRTVAARMAATITNLLRNKGCVGSDSRANKNRLYVQTDVRRLRRTTRFEHNDRNDAQTRSCQRKRV